MTPETQTQLIDLARRGAKCKAWAEWCFYVLTLEDGEPKLSRPYAAAHNFDLWARKKGQKDRPNKFEIVGPLPSTGYLDDQLGEFLERAGFGIGQDELDSWIGKNGIGVLLGRDNGHIWSYLDYMEAILNLHDLAKEQGGEYQLAWERAMNPKGEHA